MNIGFNLRRFTMRRIARLSIGIALLCSSAGLAWIAEVSADVGTGIDLMFVIDNSGSMRKNDPDFNTPRVVSTFLRRLPKEAQVGMVSFDRSARLLESLTPLDDDSAEQRFLRSLEKIDYKGQWTNSAAGFERALYELKVKGRPDARKGIIFITDGITDTGDPHKDQELNQWLRQDFTAESRALGVRIFGIAFTEEADFVLIQALASRTEGEYYRTYDASEILIVLDDILTRFQPPTADTLPPKAPQPLATLPEPQVQPVAQPLSAAAEANGDAKSIISLFNLVLALLTTVVAAGIVFLFVKQYRSKRKPVRPTTDPRKQPEAYLDDVDRVTGKEAGRIAITKAHTTIGRDPRNDITIAKATVSSFHATIEYRGLAFYIEDQRSTNGTRVNDQVLRANTPMRLKSGDRISFATFHFKFTIPEQMPFGETVMVSMTALEGPESGSTVIIDLNDQDSAQGLISCMQNHLLQLYSMGPKYKQFATSYFPYDTIDAIACKAHANLKKTQSDGRQYCDAIIEKETFYLICTLPVPISSAAEWYHANHQGFTKFVMQWIRSPQYETVKCRRLCVFTFGQDPATWVSLTIVPTHPEPDPVEIISVDFLTESEKAMLALDFDHHGRVM